MRTAQPDVRARDRRHANEVEGARNERREGRRKRDQPEDLHADRRGDHLLLGDVHLEESVGRGFLEILGVRRVGHFRVEHDDVFARGSERRERFAVGLPRRDGFGVRLECERPRPLHRRSVPALGLRDGERARAGLATQLRDRLLRLLGVERLAVPAFFVLDERHTLALHGPGKDRGRSAGSARAAVRVVDLGRIVPVDDDRIDAEGARARGVRTHVPLEFGGPALTQAVHVKDRGEIGEPLVAGVVEGLPDRALRALAVTDEDPHVVRRIEHALAGERDSHADR